jgi:photosynthetic reaction center H subunit
MMGLTSSIDLAEILFTLFWLFFIGLVLYLHREGKREGYPLESDRSGSVTVQGFPGVPKPKEYELFHGGTVQAPRDEPFQELENAEPVANHYGAPIRPTGDPMTSGVGPGAYANRDDEPDLNIHGKPRFVPLRVAEGFHVDRRDPDPRGMDVLGADGEVAGQVSEIWVDNVEPMLAYYEVQLTPERGGRKVMLPVTFSKVNRGKRTVNVKAIYADQFANVPGIASDEQITRLEEDKIAAYYGAGTLYADEKRQEPLI